MQSAIYKSKANEHGKNKIIIDLKMFWQRENEGNNIFIFIRINGLWADMRMSEDRMKSARLVEMISLLQTITLYLSDLSSSVSHAPYTYILNPTNTIEDMQMHKVYTNRLESNHKLHYICVQFVIL